MIMLVLSRKDGEQIWVPQFDIALTVLTIQGRKFGPGIAAHEKIAVVRKELQDRSSKHSAHAVASGTDSESVSVG